MHAERHQCMPNSTLETCFLAAPMPVPNGTILETSLLCGAKTTYRTAPFGNALPYGTNATAESHLHETFSLAMSMAPAERQLLGGTSPKQKPSALCKAKGLTSGSLPNAPFQRRVMPLVSHPCGAWQRQHHPYGASRCHWHHALRCVALLTPRLAACCDAIRHHVLRSDVFGSLPLRDWR